jgi:hypothetical protein
MKLIFELMEKTLSRILGKFLLDESFSNPILQLVFIALLIIIVVAVTTFEKKKLASASPLWKWMLSTMGILLYLNSQEIPVTECMDEPGGSEPRNNQGASGSGTEGFSSSAVEEEILKYLNKSNKTIATQQRVFDSAIKELKLSSADALDRAKIMEILSEKKNGQYKGAAEARDELVMEYSKYYQEKYGKSLFL